MAKFQKTVEDCTKSANSNRMAPWTSGERPGQRRTRLAVRPRDRLQRDRVGLGWSSPGLFL